jgi:hypothetical protein
LIESRDVPSLHVTWTPALAQAAAQSKQRTVLREDALDATESVREFGIENDESEPETHVSEKITEHVHRDIALHVKVRVAEDSFDVLE